MLKKIIIVNGTIINTINIFYIIDTIIIICFCSLRYGKASSIDKCLDLHVGKVNPIFIYHHKCHVTTGPDYVKDLSITLSKNFTFHEYINRIFTDCY